MAQLAAQVGDLKAQMAAGRMAEDEMAEKELAHREAIAALQRVEASLALGNRDVEADLALAESGLAGPASAAFASARQSLDNGDLYSARQFLQQAMSSGSPGSGAPGGQGNGGRPSRSGR